MPLRQLELLQWALLARLGGEIWGEPEQPEEPTLLGLWRMPLGEHIVVERLFPCFSMVFPWFSIIVHWF